MAPTDNLNPLLAHQRGSCHPMVAPSPDFTPELGLRRARPGNRDWRATSSLVPSNGRFNLLTGCDDWACAFMSLAAAAEERGSALGTATDAIDGYGDRGDESLYLTDLDAHAHSLPYRPRLSANRTRSATTLPGVQDQVSCSPGVTTGPSRPREPRYPGLRAGWR
jgi:hypothetical protein